MNKDLLKEYWMKGVESALEDANVDLLEKQALVGSEDFIDSVSDKIQQGVANALVRSGFQIVGEGAKGAIRAAMGTKLRGRHKEFIAKLMQKDSILRNRPKERVISHYKTMVKVAPSISLDPNVVASFLRESTAFESMSTVTVKTLIDLEKTMIETKSKTTSGYGSLIGMKGGK